MSSDEGRTAHGAIVRTVVFHQVKLMYYKGDGQKVKKKVVKEEAG